MFSSSIRNRLRIGHLPIDAIPSRSKAQLKERFNEAAALLPLKGPAAKPLRRQAKPTCLRALCGEAQELARSVCEGSLHDVNEHCISNR